ncbi:MAG TPA: ATP-binding protein [Puia sp.]|nr:ATP-binding protein [Puia sp.]
MRTGIAESLLSFTFYSRNMKSLFSPFLLLLIASNAIGQTDSAAIRRTLDSLRIPLEQAGSDTARIRILEDVGNAESNKYVIVLYEKALALAQKNNYPENIVDLDNDLGNYFWTFANYPKALGYYMDALKIADRSDYKSGIARSRGNLGNTYMSLGNYRQSLNYIFGDTALVKSLHKDQNLTFGILDAAKDYIELHKLDSALIFAQKGYQLAKTLDSVSASFLLGLASQSLGDISLIKKDTAAAVIYFRAALPYYRENFFDLGVAEILQSLAYISEGSGQRDSSIYYAKESLRVADSAKVMTGVISAARFLSKIYEQSNEHESLYYLKKAAAANDSVFNLEKNNQVQDLSYNELMRQKDKEESALQYQSNIKLYGSVAGLFVVIVFAVVLLRNNKQRKKANTVLQYQKEEIQSTLSELRSAQAQLIQSEKMASLGELTSGIAHEIQNPLNFVNNFSEINKELVEELNVERLKPNAERNTQLENEILNDIKDNSEKINHHGKRADAIVKGMLQHSRSGTGVKELTDINALADEYLRLSYHGLRVKDNSFNVTMKTDLDNTIGKINIIPQDIGRVLLNLYNNAFYALAEKSKLPTKDLSGFENLTGLGNFVPTITVNTKKIENRVFIAVSDNGSGIPQKVVDKIFQPFFTTKPTGQGTGLGLSLSYDIIKAHRGEIKVNTKENEGSEFIIELPLK